MSKDTLMAKYETLPTAAQKQVEMLVNSLAKMTATKSARAAGRRLKFDWAGGLAEMGTQVTGVELQHQLNGWR
jgi:hypothetical protein